MLKEKERKAAYPAKSTGLCRNIRSVVCHQFFLCRVLCFVWSIMFSDHGLNHYYWIEEQHDVRAQRITRLRILSPCACSVAIIYPVLKFFALIQKVRLISQPDFGHALREAQLTIANLSGQVTQAEISEREAKGLICNMRERIESLEGEVNELQVIILIYKAH